MSPCIVERLPNGFTTAIIEVPGRHQVLITLLVRTGSRFEAPEAAGISHLVEHMLFRGCAAYPDARRLNLAFEEAGGIPNACTGVESTEYYFVAHPGKVEQGLAVLAEMVCRPVFPEVEKERGIVMEEILYDYNDRGELIHLGALSAQLLWPETGLGQPVIGDQASVASIGEQALRAHHARHYAPHNLVLGIAGSLAPARGFELARACFGHLTNGAGDAPATTPISASHPAPQPSEGPLVKLVPDADNQFHLQLSFPAAGYNDPDEFLLGLLVRVLDDGPTSRLQQRIREDLALAYHVGAEYTAYHDTGQLDVVTSFKAGRLEEMLGALLDCLKRFGEEGPTAEELLRARERCRLDLEFARDSLDARIERYVWPLLYSTPREIEQDQALLEAASLDELRRLARQVFTRSGLHLVLVGPVDAGTEQAVADALKRF